MEKIGFIGLGRMGLPMAANLVRGNYPVWGFDTDDHQLEQAGQKGCTLCSSVSAVVEIADIVITMLPILFALTAILVVCTTLNQPLGRRTGSVFIGFYLAFLSLNLSMYNA